MIYSLKHKIDFVKYFFIELNYITHRTGFY